MLFHTHVFFPPCTANTGISAPIKPTTSTSTGVHSRSDSPSHDASSVSERLFELPDTHRESVLAILNDTQQGTSSANAQRLMMGNERLNVSERAAVCCKHYCCFNTRVGHADMCLHAWSSRHSYMYVRQAGLRSQSFFVSQHVYVVAPCKPAVSVSSGQKVFLFSQCCNVWAQVLTGVAQLPHIHATLPCITCVSAVTGLYIFFSEFAVTVFFSEYSSVCCYRTWATLVTHPPPSVRPVRKLAN